MKFSQAQQKAMNLVADALSETKKTQEKFKAEGLGDDCGYEEKEVIYLLDDVAIKVSLKVETISADSIVRD